MTYKPVLDVDRLPDLARFLRLLIENEHFHRWVAKRSWKIVHCGEHYS